MNPFVMSCFASRRRRAVSPFAYAMLSLAALAALGGCDSGTQSGPQDGNSSADNPGEPPLAGADIGGPFTLNGASGKTVRWGDFVGEYRIVYFGYAYCPDVCPTDVQRMSQGLAEFTKAHPKRGAKVQPIFISIDPERDTPEKLSEFTHAFSDRLIGLTGSPEQVAAAAKAFRVYYERGEETSPGAYLMNHSTITYLFDPDGKPLATLPTDKGAKAVAAELDKWVN